MRAKGLKTMTTKEMPRDFWNYDVNPITGYSISDHRENEEIALQKYDRARITATQVIPTKDLNGFKSND